MDGQTKGTLSVLLSALLFGSMGVLVRLVAGEGVGPFSQVLVRVLIATAILSLIVIPRTKDFFCLKSKTDLLLYFVAGALGYGLMLILFTLAILKTTIANTFFLLFTEPVFVIILASVFLGEKITKRLMVSVALCLLGVFLIFNPAALAGNLAGNVYALGSGFFYAVYILIGRYMGNTYAPLKSTLWSFIFALLFLIPVSAILEPGSMSMNMSAPAWLMLFVFALVNISAYFLLNAGLKKITAGYGSLLLVFEPVSSMAYAFLFFSEVPSATTILGAALILTSVLHLTLAKK